MKRREELFEGLNKLLSCLGGVGNIFFRWNEKLEQLSTIVLEMIVLLLYMVLHVVISFFHEPWYDEAVAWQIAKYEPIKDILWEVPHYEGHPPLWHLVLVPFAKLGVPYEFSLMIVSLFFATATVFCILWKSPFPRAIKLLMPFTYFIFYQYGVISRPYCMMMLAFVLLAITYKTRDEKPGRYVLSLAFLCLTSAYGLIIAGGISAVWVLKIIYDNYVMAGLRRIWQDRRLQYLFVLLIFACLLILEILPKENTFAIINRQLQKSKGEENGILLRLFYTMFVLPIDCILTNSLKDMFLLYAEIDLVSGTLAAVIMFCLFGICVKKIKKRICILEIVLPYILFSGFAAFVYFSRHHSGIALLYFGYVAWWLIVEKDICIKQEKKRKIELYGNIKWLCIGICLIISLFWTCGACFQEIQGTYAIGRKEAGFIKKYNLDNYKIMVPWHIWYQDKEKKKVKRIDTNHRPYVTNILPYFDKNIFYNYTVDDPSEMYTTHVIATQSQVENSLQEWKKKGKPEVLIGQPQIGMLYDYSELNYNDYTLVYNEKIEPIWKCFSDIEFSKIYVRNDLLDEIGLTEVDLKH